MLAVRTWGQLMQAEKVAVKHSNLPEDKKKEQQTLDPVSSKIFFTQQPGTDPGTAESTRTTSWTSWSSWRHLSGLRQLSSSDWFNVGQNKETEFSQLDNPETSVNNRKTEQSKLLNKFEIFTRRPRKSQQKTENKTKKSPCPMNNTTPNRQHTTQTTHNMKTSATGNSIHSYNSLHSPTLLTVSRRQNTDPRCEGGVKAAE